MAQNTAELVVGATGAVYVAPVGTTLPTSIATALNASYIDLGLITEDGVTVTPSVSQEVLRAWQRLTRIRTLITERDFEIEFAMMQWNETTLPFAMGGGTIATDVAGPPIEYSYDFPDADVRDERSLVVEWQDGTKNYRLVIPRCEVSDLAEFTVVRTDSANLGVTVNVVSNPADDYTMRLQTDDTAFRGMSHFSLDDITTEGFSFELAGESFSGDSVPALFYTRGMGGDLEAAVEALLGDDAERFWRLKPTIRQIEALVSRIATELGSDAGKSERAYGVVQRHRWALDADLRRFWGLTLTEAASQPFLLAEMVASLPDDSATIRAELGPEESAWGVTEHLLAVIVELLDRHDRHMLGALVDQKKNPQVRKFLKTKPMRIPRPGVEAKWKNRKGTTLGELLGMMGGKTEV